ncbi:TetR/AcrR family transcriptional regulator [Agrobacterium pusense]|uniref:TetR/AcrR family transcriptional regulator n=1 Tax=Agrobacterium pusense TaxID=648995 RepID=UPI003FD6B6D2
MKRTKYHHGELKAALIAAASDIIREHGIEGFSLREAARRADVSPGAPAHHFKTAKGLLTEVALAGYRELGKYLSDVNQSGHAPSDIALVSLAYVRFALDHPGLFRLMFRNDLVDRADPRYETTTLASLEPFTKAANAYRKLEGMDLIEEKAALLAVWAAVHGMAHLVLEEKVHSLFGASSAEIWVEKQLKGVLEEIWQSHGDGRAN